MGGGMVKNEEVGDAGRRGHVCDHSPPRRSLQYPTPKEKMVIGIKTVEERQDGLTGVIYRRKIATCANVLPRFLRQLGALQVDNVRLEEESWLDVQRRVLDVQSRCLTWTHLATMHEQATLHPSPRNPTWTEFVQHGTVAVTGLGSLGRLVEMFAHTFLSQGAKRSVRIMDGLLEERYGCPAP
ncbi:PRELI domain-containing protein 2 isoform X2 [Petromyzon marinus]|uniref:PRELI domain-containing protein 2 isoform X2 n=1 Tax=Petromyzon marinus TaxID=7757 RepID=UPI003F6E715E